MENLDNNELYKKGSVLLQSALKKYEKGDLEGGDKDRELANEFFDQAKNETNRISQNISALYGENRNFGVIYKVFEENAKDIIKENKNNKAISKIIKMIKSNNILNEQFKVYNTLCNKIINIDADAYLNEAISIIPSFTKRELIENNSRLIDIIKENKLDELIEIDNDTLQLYESVEFLLMNKKSLNNIEQFKECKDIIKESIEKRYIDYNNNKKDNTTLSESDYKMELRQVINKHLENLNEDEIKLVEEICNGNKKEVFDKYKNETITYITEQLSSSIELEDKIDWNTVLNKVNLKKFNESTILEDVVSFINIKNIIEE